MYNNNNVPTYTVYTSHAIYRMIYFFPMINSWLQFGKIKNILFRYRVGNIISVYKNVDLIFNRRARTTVKSIVLNCRIGIYTNVNKSF